MVLENLVLRNDSAAAESKSVIRTGVYNNAHYTQREENLLQSIIVPCNIRAFNIGNDTRMTNFSSTLV